MDFGWGLSEFLRKNEGMSVRPTADASLRVQGTFDFEATMGDVSGSGTFELALTVVGPFPRALPTVVELGGRVPPDHVNPDGSLCLGSPLRLSRVILESPMLCTFAQRCIVPYLFGIAVGLPTGNVWPFGELAHGDEGLVDDYAAMFQVGRAAVPTCLGLLALPHKKAGRRPCPCRSGRPFSQCGCATAVALNMTRRAACRTWFEAEAKRLGEFVARSDA